MGRALLAMCLLIWTLDLRAEHPIKGYSTQLTLDSVVAGSDQTLTGTGAPGGAGIYVELWRVAPGTAAAEPVKSVRAVGGDFSFEGVDVLEGEHYYVTLSRSWHFNTDGHAEGWDQVVVNSDLSVSGGSLNIEVTGIDPHFYNYFDYNSDYYRVVEIRLKNPAVAAFQNPALQHLSIFWGDFGTRINRHFGEIPFEATDFETIMIPMNVGEVMIDSTYAEHYDLDGLWATGLHDLLRIDPLDPTPGVDLSGMVFQIDYIRIREDFRYDFHTDDDPMGIGAFNNMTDVSISGGHLNLSVGSSALDPHVLFGLATGKIESQYFTNFAVGLEGFVAADSSSAVSLLFHDDDSGSGYNDDYGAGPLQIATFPLGSAERQDLFGSMDAQAAGEWTEDGRVPVKGMQLGVPTTPGSMRIDYVALVPDNPYGPSDPVFIPYPNNPPVAIIVSDPPASSPVQLVLRRGKATATLDGTESHDGDDGSQELSYWWDGDGEGVVIDQPDQSVVEAVFTAPGEYLCRLTVSDGELKDSVTQVVIVKTRKVAGLERYIETVEQYVEKLKQQLAEKKEELEASYGSEKKSKKEHKHKSGNDSRKIEKSIKTLERRIKCASRLLEKLNNKLEKEKAKTNS